MKNFLRIVLYTSIFCIVTAIDAQRLLDVQSVYFDQGNLIKQDTVKLNDKLAGFLRDVQVQGQMCSSPAIPASAAAIQPASSLIGDNPLYSLVYEGIFKRQKDCEDSLNAKIVKYLEVVDLQAAKILQFQGIYIQSSARQERVLDSILLIQHLLRQKRKVLENLESQFRTSPILNGMNDVSVRAMRTDTFIARINRSIHIGQEYFDTLSTTILETNNVMTSINTAISKWSAAGAAKPEDKKGVDNVMGLPQLIQTDEIVTPSVTMVAGAQTGKKFYNELGFFAGNTGEKNRQNVQSTFNAEQSEYGFYVRGILTSFEFLDSKYEERWALNYHTNYLQKSVITDTTQQKSPVNFGQFYGRIAPEFIIFPEILSIYAGLNWNTPITNLKSYEEELPFARNGHVYLDFGFRMLLQPGKDSGITANGLGLIIDINFIVNDGDMRKANSKGDSLVPGLRFGLQKSLSTAKK